MSNSTTEGIIYGFAYGDSWGKDTEFNTHETNLSIAPEFPEYAQITDDTQMSLYTIYAIMDLVETNPEIFQNLQKETDKRNFIRVRFADSYLEWLQDPDNNRAPGTTCITALRTYGITKQLNGNKKLTGLEGTNLDSKGCGANMRTGWLGLLPFDEETLINLSILQSETTHGHPLALSASVLTTLAVKAIKDKEIQPGNDEYFTWLLNKTKQLVAETEIHGQDAPGSWNYSYQRGLNQLIEFLNEKEPLLRLVKKQNKNDDISQYLGEGWVAEEALLVGLITADYYHDEPVEALRRLVYSSGDSDSIAAFGGMFIGAAQGDTVFPHWWKNHFEQRYAEELDETLGFFERISDR